MHSERLARFMVSSRAGSKHGRWRWGGRESGFSRWQVFMLPIVYAAFVAAIVFWVQPFGQDAQVGSGGGQRSGQQQEQIGQLFAHFGPEAGACVG